MSTMNRAAALAALDNATWVMEPSQLDAMVRAVRSDDILAAVGRRSGAPATMTGSVAVMSLVGLILYRPGILTDIFGGVSLVDWSIQFRSLLRNKGVAAIVLDIDSGGGTATGVSEIAGMIREGRRIKPIISVANGWAASAAFWLGSAGSAFYALGSGEVGSIGVRTLHVDYSRANEAAGRTVTYIVAGKYKAEGNPDEPLGDEAKRYFQSRVDDVFRQFSMDVARNRSVSIGRVLADWGEGRMLSAPRAKQLGMIDGIVSSLEDVVPLAQAAASGRVVGRREAALRAAEIREAELQLFELGI